MKNKKLVFKKAEGSKKRFEGLESDVQFAQVSDAAYDGKRTNRYAQDETGQFQVPSQEIDVELLEKVLIDRCEGFTGKPFKQP